MRWQHIDTAPPGDARVLLFVPRHGFETNLVVIGFRFYTRDLRGLPMSYWKSANGGPVDPSHWAPTSALPLPETETDTAASHKELVTP